MMIHFRWGFSGFTMKQTIHLGVFNQHMTEPAGNAEPGPKDEDFSTDLASAERI
jgi:hypothetical protein